MVPGRILHRLAGSFCSPRMLQHVIEPAIADLQKEYADAAAHRSGHRRSWVLLTGYSAVLKVLTLSIMEPFAPGSEERRALARTLAWAVGVTFAVTLTLMLVPLTLFFMSSRELMRPIHLVRVIPQALPLAIPLGLTLGIALGLGGRAISRGARLAVLVIALGSSAASFAVMNYVMPQSNQAFRQDLFSAMGNIGVVMKGSNEMTLTELQREIGVARSLSEPERLRTLPWNYHLRWALPLSTLVLALFAFAPTPRGVIAPRALPMASCVLYFLLLFVGEGLVLRGNISAFAGAWLPNVVFTSYLLLLTSYLHASIIKPSHRH